MIDQIAPHRDPGWVTVSTARDLALLDRSLKTLATGLATVRQGAKLGRPCWPIMLAVGICSLPRIESDPGHEIASRQMSDFGAIVECSPVRGPSTGRFFVDALTLIKPAGQPGRGGVDHLQAFTDESCQRGSSERRCVLASMIGDCVSVGIEGVGRSLDEFWRWRC